MDTLIPYKQTNTNAETKRTNIIFVQRGREHLVSFFLFFLQLHCEIMETSELRIFFLVYSIGYGYGTIKAFGVGLDIFWMQGRETCR